MLPEVCKSASRECDIKSSVAIAVYNQAHFLADALDSVFAQTRKPDQIIVVDDGSRDNPETVVRRYPGVEYVRQANAGLSAARNTGLAHAVHETILFLDADDMLLPRAMEHHVTCLEANPDAALVYGGHRRVDVRGDPIGPDKFDAVSDDAYADFLRGNMIGMHATVLYRRKELDEIGGFDTALRKCEDYDVYLRLSHGRGVAHHPHIVAEYRIHGENMSGDPAAMLEWIDTVRTAQRPVAARRREHALAWKQGRAIWRDYYVAELLDDSRYRGSPDRRRKAYLHALRISPMRTGADMIRRLRKRAVAALPAGLHHRLKRAMGRASQPPVGHVDLGDLDRVRPVSFDFGFDRGTPVDRHYIETFLGRNGADIRGRVLEIGDASYCRQFGTGIERQDVLHVDPDAEGATIVGDLSQPGVLPEGAFDCLVITQTLHLIYDMPTAIERLYASLKPGGVLLLTVPGISPIDRGEWGETWYWSLTDRSAERLFADRFGAGNVEVAAHGNAYAATCFIQGLALEEVDRKRLDKADRHYPVVVTVRAVRGE